MAQSQKDPTRDLLFYINSTCLPAGIIILILESVYCWMSRCVGNVIIFS